jgi:hypothetical protein
MGTALLLSPTCKAQSEVSPDHFDGTDSWATASRPQAPKTATKASLQSKTQENGQGATLQMASSREVTKAAPRGTATADRKRKTVASKTPEKK